MRLDGRNLGRGELGTIGVGLVDPPDVEAGKKVGGTEIESEGGEWDEEPERLASFSSSPELERDLPANGSFRTALGSPLAASLARFVASSRAILAAALAPSGPVSPFPFERDPVERLAVGCSVRPPESDETAVSGERDTVEDEGEPLAGEGAAVEEDEMVLGGFPEEGCRR